MMSEGISSSAPSQRQLRAGELVRHALANLLQSESISDPRLEGAIVSVSEVSMSPDLRVATAFVSPLGADAEKADALVEALSDNSRFIRGRLSGELGRMKYMPELRFRRETRFDNYARIERLLDSPPVARDLETPSQVPPSQVPPSQATPSQAAPSQVAPSQVTPESTESAE